MAEKPSGDFKQTVLHVGHVQVISASDELFNHVDDNLPMWAGDGDRSVRHILKKIAQQLELEEYEATQAVLQFVRLLHRRKIVALMAKPTD